MHQRHKKVRSVSAKKERKRAMQTSITKQGYLLNSVGLKEFHNFYPSCLLYHKLMKVFAGVNKKKVFCTKKSVPIII